MNERKRLLRKVAMYAFSMWELHIYLDTHPNDRKAKAMHDEYMKKYNRAVEEYERLYGPLKITNVDNNTMAQWIDDPWPWDLEAN